MQHEEMTLAEIEGKAPPKYEVIDGFLYCDHTRVEQWQLTTDELKKYFPERFQEKYGVKPEFNLIPCPMPECSQAVQDRDLRSCTQHLRQKHESFWAQHRRKLQSQTNLAEMIEYVKAQFRREEPKPAA